MIVEIVQADFAPCNDLGPLCQLFELSESRVGRQSCLMGMNTYSGVDEFVLRSQFDATIQTSRAVTISNRDDGLDSRFACPYYYLLAISLKLLAVKMGMGIDENESLVVGHLWFGDLLCVTLCPLW